MAPPQAFQLMDLPLEIRRQIFRSVLEHEHQGFKDTGNENIPWTKFEAVHKASTGGPVKKLRLECFVQPPHWPCANLKLCNRQIAREVASEMKQLKTAKPADSKRVLAVHRSENGERAYFIWEGPSWLLCTRPQLEICLRGRLDLAAPRSLSLWNVVIGSVNLINDFLLFGHKIKSGKVLLVLGAGWASTVPGTEAPDVSGQVQVSTTLHRAKTVVPAWYMGPLQIDRLGESNVIVASNDLPRRFIMANDQIMPLGALPTLISILVSTIANVFFQGETVKSS